MFSFIYILGFILILLFSLVRWILITALPGVFILSGAMFLLLPGEYKNEGGILLVLGSLLIYLRSMLKSRNYLKVLPKGEGDYDRREHEQEKTR